MGLRVGSITFGGLSSGLPTDDIIQQLLDLERRPITLLENQRDTFNTRLDIFNDLETKTRALRDSLRTLDNLGLLGNTQSAEEEFSRFGATTTDATVVTASATGLASPTSLNIRVTQLAAAERQITDKNASGYATSDDVVGTGTFGIQIGTGSVQNVTIDSSSNTVSGFVQAINDQVDGVTASVLNDGTGTNPIHIVIQADDTGSANTLTFTDGLTGGTNPSFVTSQAAADATILLDPEGAATQITSSTNTFQDVLTGVTLQAQSESAANTQELIEIEPDVDAVVSAIQDLVTAFNAVTSAIQEQFEVDPATNRGGPLIGDSTLTSLSQRLTTSIASQLGSGSTITSASQIGISTDSNAQLTLDEDELRAQLEADFDEVRSFFAGSGGLADSLRTVADSFVDSVDGALVARISGASETIQDLTDQITDAQDRLGTLEENLVRQFASLERILSEVQIQGNFLAQFLVSQQR